MNRPVRYVICFDLAKSSSITTPDGSKVTPLVHETCADRTHPGGNYRSCSGYSLDPTYTGRFTADSNGEVKFGFENKKEGQHVKFSGIAVTSGCPAPSPDEKPDKKPVAGENWLLFCWKQCDVQSQKVSKIAPNGWLETGNRVQTGTKLQLVPMCKLVPFGGPQE